MKFIKHIIYLSFAFLLTACEINDRIDDIMKVGYKAPNVYWEIPSSSAKAGDSIRFSGQYYTEVFTIDHLEVWYDVNEITTTSISCPWLVSFKFIIATDKTVKSRVFQQIATYKHNEENWDKTKIAYQLNSKFPTSNTLRTVEWKDVEIFDNVKFEKLFSSKTDIQFKDSLYKMLKFVDIRKIMIGLEAMTEPAFKALTDSVKNDNSGGWDYSIKSDKLALVKQKYDEIPFQKLIYNTSESKYMIEYSRSYKLNACLKAFNSNMEEGYSEKKQIDLR